MKTADESLPHDSNLKFKSANAILPGKKPIIN
jgi:hypothetical protein